MVSGWPIKYASANAVENELIYAQLPVTPYDFSPRGSLIFKDMQCRWCKHLRVKETPPIETVQHLFDVCSVPKVAALRIPELASCP